MIDPANHVFTIDSGTPTINTGRSKFGGSSLRCASGEAIKNLTFKLPEEDVTDWTIEFWVNWQSDPGAPLQPGATIMGGGTTDTRPSWTASFMGFIGDRYQYIWFGQPAGNGITISTSSTLVVNTWYHLAFVKTGTGITDTDVFRDGTQVRDTGNSSQNFNNLLTPTTFFIGSVPGGINSDIWVDEVRISETARWTTNFTPETSPYETDQDTSLLMHFDGDNGSTVFLDEHIPEEYPQTFSAN